MPARAGQQTVASAGQTSGNARPSRTADRVIGKRIGECHADALEAFQVRQLADVVHGRFQPLGSHLIDHEKDDVGLVRCVHKVLSINGDSFCLRAQSFHRPPQTRPRTAPAAVVPRCRMLTNQVLVPWESSFRLIKQVFWRRSVHSTILL